jgi:hypothetical protein
LVGQWGLKRVVWMEHRKAVQWGKKMVVWSEILRVEHWVEKKVSWMAGNWVVSMVVWRVESKEWKKVVQ